MDIFGVVMIFRYGLPITLGSDLKDRGVIIRSATGEITMVPAQSIQRRAEFGLGLLCLGFLSQAIGSCFILSS